MRVVVDTNIFISSFFGGNPRKVINLWKDGKLTLCVSKEILDEYFYVLQRIGLKDEEEMEELLSLFSRSFNMLFVNKTPKIKVIDDDPDDDKFIECAISLKAKAVISGDRHLLSIHEYMGIKLLTPQQFLMEYGRE